MLILFLILASIKTNQMSRPRKSKYKNRKRKGKEPVSKFEMFKRPAKTLGGFIFRNIFIGVVFYILLSSLYNRTAAYKWDYEQLYKINYNVIVNYSDYTTEQKYQSKLGFYGKYMFFVKSHTPDTAIILMPPDSVIFAIDKKNRMGWLTSKRHSTYFLYPRKPIYKKLSSDSIYFDKITHVVIVDGKGYENLPFKVKNKNKYTVIPTNLHLTKKAK